MATARDVHPEVKRALGASGRLSSESNEHAARAKRLLDQASGKKPEKRSISPASFGRIEDEITETKHNLEELRREIRQKQPSQSEIHVHVDSKPDSDPPESEGAHSGFSVEGPLGWQLRARGRIAWAVVAIVALVVVGILAGRLTAPKQERPVETAHPK